MDGDDEPPPAGDREIKGLKFKGLRTGTVSAIDFFQDYFVDISDNNCFSGRSELEDGLQQEVMPADLYQSSPLELKELKGSVGLGEMYRPVTDKDFLPETVETEIMRSMLGRDGPTSLFDLSSYDPSLGILRLFVPYNGEDSCRKPL
ncbi:MAG TPA: hypothetical protein VJG49_02940 [Candidatus Nanoarchaeia archaeon]|nr:hypothetical protein [Candidatus Nanoarchaeia archaeon]